MMLNRLGGALALAAARKPAVESGSGPLVGVWVLHSIDTEFRESGERQSKGGRMPQGHLIFTPLGRFMAVLMGTGRSEMPADRENETSFRRTFVYSGQYRLRGDRWVTRVDHTWNDAWADGEQSHSFSLDGDRLEVASAWRLGPKSDERLQRTVFSFKKMK